MAILVWPGALLIPAQVMINPVPFTRSGGRTLGGLERSTRTDRGWWEIGYKGIALHSAAQRRVWNALRVYLGGSAGILAVPAWSLDSAPWPSGSSLGNVTTLHSDGTPHSDTTPYSQPGITATMTAAAALGATSVSITLGSGIAELSGIRFSYRHALYETGIPTLVSGAVWTLPVFPSIRAAIPAGAQLEFALPTCLVKLATDRAMDVSLSAGHFDRVDVSFVESTDYWNDLALTAG